MTEMKENCRKQTGNLKINNKLYPIYEGLNIMGRDAKSTIILKETIFSKLHAAISVVDANTHLICDLNSSNGTQLGKMKLVPYKFYSIKDHEPIIFGDVVGMYFKGTELQNNCVIKISSQIVDHEGSTQILNNLNNTVENIHDLPTQVFSEINDKIISLNVHEAPTQIFPEIETNKKTENIHEAPTQFFPETNKTENIHEAPTQIFPETNKKTENIHEAPTQIFPETNKKAENIHEAPTQIFPETNKKTENTHEVPTQINIHDESTQYVKPEENLTSISNVSNYNINDSDDDATQDLDPKIKETYPEVETQDDDEEILSRSDVYDDIFANESFRSSLERSAPEIEAIEVDETVLIASQKNVEQFKKPDNPEKKIVANNEEEISDDDDIILSTQDSEAIDQKYREHQEKLNSTLDKANEKIPEEVSDSDATDVEDELLLANVILTTEVPDTPETMDVVNEEVVAENNVNEEDTDEEEIDLLASTCSKTDSNTEEFDLRIKEAELPPTQLLTTTTTTITSTTTTTSTITTTETKEASDDELPATQLLHSKKDPQEKEDSFLAPTQLLVPETTEKTSKTNDDDVYLAATQKICDVEENTTSKNDEKDEAATQMLPPKVPETIKTTQNKVNHDDSATQLLPPEVTETNKRTEQDSIFSAETQFFPPENDEDDKFAAATQILSHDGPVQNDENIFSAATQILPIVDEENQDKVVQNEEDVFSAPTQLILCPENEESNKQADDVFSAPTQILLEEDELLKESHIRLSSESNCESMRLHLSETDHSMPNQEQQLEQNTETQLEVNFELETQKLYIEEKTRRPDNPLSHLFAEEATQMTETEPHEKAGDVDNENNDENKELDTTIENRMKLTPIVSVVDIKKSKITLKDIQEASTSKIKKSYVKLERIRQEPTRRSNRNAKVVENDSETPEEENIKTTRRRTKLGSTEVADKTVIKEENIKKETTRRRTKYTSIETTPAPKISDKQEKGTNEEVPKEERPTKRRTKKSSSTESEITSSVESKEKVLKTPPSSIKEVTKKLEESKSKSASKIQLSKKLNESLESSEEADFKTNSSRHNTRGKRRDYKSIASGKLEDEDESKNAKGRITSKSFIKEKIEELEIHVKEERPKRSAAKLVEETDSDDSVFRSKRSKRNSSKEKVKEKEVVEDTDESSIEINIRKRVPRIEDSQESEPSSRLKRNRKQTEASRASKQVDTEKGRSRRTLKNSKQTSKDDNDKIVIEIEDSDESILEQHKHNNPESTIQTRKRNSQTSPERNKLTPSDVCLNTPNSKRRKYEPLGVNISSSQISNSNDSAEHKVVFTMLNDTDLENIVRKLGGSVVDAIRSCTVLVTNKISRSFKFLIAVALGKPIVHVKWILDSEKRKKFLDPWDYLLEDAESEAKFQMSLKQSLTTSRNKKLLAGETILLAAVKNSAVLKEIIETSGGKCVTRAPPKNAKAIVVCYEDEKSKYSKYLKQKSLIVVSAEAIFSGVLQQKINWKQYVLS